jgi:ABC-2 type transport system permease protein
VGLLYNEVQKIITQRRFIIVLGLITLLIIALSVSVRNEALIGMTAADEVSTWTYGAGVTFFFPCVLAVLIGDIVAGELAGGTMKLLLIRPVSRWKIWLSKLFAAYIVSAATYVYFALCAFVAYGAAQKFGSFSAHMGGDPTGPIIGAVVLKSFGLVLLTILSIVSLFVFLSTVVENGTAAAACCWFSVVFCEVAPFFVHTKWIEYLFSQHWSIAQHVVGTFDLPDWSLEGSACILVAWIVLFAAAGMALFQYRDVKS